MTWTSRIDASDSEAREGMKGLASIFDEANRMDERSLNFNGLDTSPSYAIRPGSKPITPRP